MTTKARTARPSIEDLIEEKARADSGYAVAFALLRLADVQRRLVVEVNRLGNADAATPMGAIELLGKTVGEKMEMMGEGLDAIAAALQGTEP